MKTLATILAVAAGCTLAQQKDTMIYVRQAGPGPMGVEAMMGGTIKGAPYTADVTTESVQVLQDGNRIVNRSTAFVARDSQGRTRHEAEVGMVSTGAQAKPMKIVMIHDPAAGVTYTLEPGSKIARKMPAPTFVATADQRQNQKMRHEFMIQPGSMTAAAGGAVFNMKVDGPGQVEGPPKVEELGSQVIEGVLADGVRTTFTIPAGAAGNEKEIRIVDEVWTAQDLKAIVLSKHTDPRSGEMTYKLSNIQRAEPASSLFEIPADYTVQDVPKNVMVWKPKE